MVVKPRGESTAIDKNKSTLRIGMIGQVNLGISPPPIILLIKTSHHLTGNPFKRTELLFQMSEDLLMAIVPLIADGYAGKLVID
jgi:hypothetical protein